MGEILDASLICMGTHGLKGVQYLLGSKAIKVVSATTIPFIITQSDQPLKDEIHDIVVPIDFASEEKRVLSISARLAKALKGKLNVIGAGHDDPILSKKVDLNLSFTQRFLAENNVHFEVSKGTSSKNFQGEILDKAKDSDADIIAIVNHHEDGVRNLLGGNFDQNIITNKLKLPVLIFTGKSLVDKRDIFGMFR
jgi:nucleotide-binding universal stress UspA family protein